MTQPETLQRLFWQFEIENNHKPQTARAVIEWAVDRGWIELPIIDPIDVLTKQMSRALREEMATDPTTGKRYRKNHSIRVVQNGEQKTLWTTLDYGAPEDVHKAFAQRREMITGDCWQLKTDVDVFNSRNPKDSFNLVLDFGDDIAEREMELAAL